MSEKPLDATAARLAKARKDGDHPVAHDAVAAAAFAGGAAAVIATAPWFAQTARAAIEDAAAGRSTAGAAIRLAAIALAATIASAAAACAATVLQTRGFVWRGPQMRFEELLSAESFKRLFSRRSALAAVRASAVVAVASVATGWIVWTRLPFGIAPAAPAAGAAEAGHAIVLAGCAVAAAGIAAAAFDAAETHRAWRERLRMTHDEVQREHRENEGDPQTRARRRRMHRTIVRGSLREVRRASFVVANPTHVAVAVRYDPVETPVPAILVRAVEEGALRVKSIAVEERIPIVEDAPLARALYAHGSLGTIPRELYAAVAELIAALAHLRAP